MMEKIETFDEVIYNLKQGYIITLDGKDSFYYRNHNLTHRFNGNSFRISLKTFSDLYKGKTFYLKEDNEVTIDDEKDKDYYQRYRK